MKLNLSCPNQHDAIDTGDGLDTELPEPSVSRWFNTQSPPTLAMLRGRVVMLHTFQMLCPGCVNHSLPQATRVHQAHTADDLAVIGLHTVFEHHAVMTPQALEVFIHEYRIGYPVGVDAPGDDAVPRTMQRYGLLGTPSLILVDKAGRLRLRHFGGVDDLQLGLALGQLLAEPAPAQNAPLRPEVTRG